jgi:hypothetical protein
MKGAVLNRFSGRASEALQPLPFHSFGDELGAEEWQIHRHRSPRYGWVSAVTAVLVVGLWLSSAATAQTLPGFEDVTQEAGIDFHHRYGDDDLSNIVEGTGAGAIFFDYDNDGWLDIYFLNGCWKKDVNDNLSRKKYRDKLSNRLYRSNRDGTFEDVTEEAGVGIPAMAAVVRPPTSTMTAIWISTC